MVSKGQPDRRGGLGANRARRGNFGIMSQGSHHGQGVSGCAWHLAGDCAQPLGAHLRENDCAYARGGRGAAATAFAPRVECHSVGAEIVCGHGQLAACWVVTVQVRGSLISDGAFNGCFGTWATPLNSYEKCPNSSNREDVFSVALTSAESARDGRSPKAGASSSRP